MARKKGKKKKPFTKAKAHRINTEENLREDVTIYEALGNPDAYDGFYCDICGARVFPVKSTSRVKAYFRASNHAKDCSRSSKKKVITAADFDTDNPDFFSILNAEEHEGKEKSAPINPVETNPNDPDEEEDDNSSTEVKPRKVKTAKDAYDLGSVISPNEIIVNEYKKKDLICYRDNARSLRNYNENDHIMLIISATRWSPDDSLTPPQYRDNYIFLKAYWPNTDENTEAIYLIVPAVNSTSAVNFRRTFFRKKQTKVSKTTTEGSKEKPQYAHDAFVILADWKIIDYNGIRFLVSEQINKKTYFSISLDNIY